MIDETVNILQSINPSTCGVRDLAKTLHRRPASIIRNLRRMEEQGLITYQFQSFGGKGRPKKTPQITDLGKIYLMRFNEMQANMLRARRTDFESIEKDLALKHRLIERGRHPHDLFIELRESLVAIQNAT